MLELKLRTSGADNSLKTLIIVQIFNKEYFFSNFAMDVFLMYRSLWDIHIFSYNWKWWRHFH